jgi:hypothetical protein
MTENWLSTRRSRRSVTNPAKQRGTMGVGRFAGGTTSIFASFATEISTPCCAMRWWPDTTPVREPAIRWRPHRISLSHMISQSSAARRWLLAGAVLGVAWLVLFPGGYDEPSTIHFLRARWAWSQPWMLLDVWGRPAFTLLYSVPAHVPLTGFVEFLAARIFSLALAIVTAWLAARIAEVAGVERPALAVPLVWLVPCFLLLSSETTTAPLFAVLLAVAIYLRQRGRVLGSLAVVSTLMLVRPEGILVAVLWAWWAMTDTRSAHAVAGRLATLIVLAVAPALWWYLAVQMTQDPLFPLHNWPAPHVPMRSVLMGGGIENDLSHWGEVLGVVFVIPFLVGLVGACRRRETRYLGGIVLLIVGARLIAGATGVLGDSIPEAFAATAPALGIVLLVGWNTLAESIATVAQPRTLSVVAGVLFAIALVEDFALADGRAESRDWRAIAEVTGWVSQHPRRLSWLLTSEAYADVLFGHDPTEALLPFGDRTRSIAKIDSAPPGTLVVWDARLGPSNAKLATDDFVQRGFAEVHRADYALAGWLPSDSTSPVLRRLRAMLHVPADEIRQETFWILQRP